MVKLALAGECQLYGVGVLEHHFHPAESISSGLVHVTLQPLLKCFRHTAESLTLLPKNKPAPFPELTNRSINYRTMRCGVDWEGPHEAWISGDLHGSPISREAPAKKERKRSRMVKGAGVERNSLWPVGPSGGYSIIQQEFSG